MAGQLRHPHPRQNEKTTVVANPVHARLALPPPRSSRYSDPAARTAKPQPPPDARPNPAPARRAPGKASACPPVDCSPGNGSAAGTPEPAPAPSSRASPVATPKAAGCLKWLPTVGEAAGLPASTQAGPIPTESGAWPRAPAASTVAAFGLT